jgi:hypothetical protein
MTLEKQAEKQAEEEYNLQTEKIPIPTSFWFQEGDNYKNWYRKGFITGATSKHVEREKLKCKIEIIEMILNCYSLLHEDCDDLKTNVNKLKQELKNL